MIACFIRLALACLPAGILAHGAVRWDSALCLGGTAGMEQNTKEIAKIESGKAYLRSIVSRDKLAEFITAGKSKTCWRSVKGDSPDTWTA